MSFEEFQDSHHGGYLRYRNGISVAILNLYVASIPPIKFWLNPTYDLGKDVVLTISLAAMAAILDIGMERFELFWISIILRCLPSSFGSTWLMDWEMSFEEFQDGHHGGHLGYPNRTILAILNLCVALMPPIKFLLNPTHGLGGVSFQEFQDGCHLISEWNHFSNSESLCHCDTSHQNLAQSELQFWRCRLKNLKMAAVAAILEIGMERF